MVSKVISLYNVWTVRMGGAGLSMVTKVSVGGAGNNDCQQRTVVTLSESCVWNGMERIQLLLYTLTCFLSTFSKFLSSHSR